MWRAVLRYKIDHLSVSEHSRIVITRLSRNRQSNFSLKKPRNIFLVIAPITDPFFFLLPSVDCMFMCIILVAMIDDVNIRNEYIFTSEKNKNIF